MRIIKFFFIYFFIRIYSLEVLLFFFNTPGQRSLIDIKSKRLEFAKKKNQIYDLRTPEEAYVDHKKLNKKLKPNFLYSIAFSDLKTFKNAENKKLLIPFRGPINSPSLSCAEDLRYRIINNDKYGFKNPNSIYNKKINSILLGDSYAEGLCEISEKDIAGNLNKKRINTINFGVTGSGPLVSLAILKEFGNIFKPKNIIYLYFEGNDLGDLSWEKNNSNLSNYLKEDYRLDYYNKYEEINLFLNAAAEETEKIILSKVNDNRNNVAVKKKKYEVFKEHFKDIMELSNLKNIVRFNLFNSEKKNYDLKLLYSVKEKMNFESKKWNGNYIFVYVPTWSRYFTKYNKETYRTSLKDEILTNLRSKKITIIDLTKFFDNESNIKKYFPLEYVGHYNEKGYKKIADIISKKLK